MASDSAPAQAMRMVRARRSAGGAASHICTPTTPAPRAAKTNWFPFCSSAPSSATPGAASQARLRAGIEGAQAGRERQRQHADEQLLQVPRQADQVNRPEQEQHAGDERRPAREADRPRQGVQAPPGQREPHQGDAVERRRRAPEPEGEGDHGVQRPDAVDEDADPVRPEEVRRVRPAHMAGDGLGGVPEHPDGVALVVVDVTDRVGGEVAGQRPARGDREQQVADGDEGAVGRAAKDVGHRTGREYSCRPGWLEPQSARLEPGPQPIAGAGAGIGLKSPDFVGDPAHAALGTAVALGRAVTVR